MTREEALEELDSLFIPRDGKQDKLADAFEMAIKALEQEPCEDAISRQAAIEKIHWLGLDHDTAIKCDLALRALPSVNPQEPKTGYWIMSDDGLYRPICNNCGAHPWKGYIPTVEEATKAFKYCPTCGIKMVEPQESEE